MTPQEMEKAIARLFEGQDLLTGKVSELTDDVAQLTENVAGLTDAVDAMREEAKADRAMQGEAIAEMRAAVSTMLGIAESMAANVTLLTTVQQGTSQRVTRLENRVDALEKGDTPN
jgi:septal ring factor EnvC (AmiA/AmiB activator)